MVQLGDSRPISGRFSRDSSRLYNSTTHGKQRSVRENECAWKISPNIQLAQNGENVVRTAAYNDAHFAGWHYQSGARDSYIVSRLLANILFRDYWRTPITHATPKRSHQSPSQTHQTSQVLVDEFRPRCRMHPNNNSILQGPSCACLSFSHFACCWR